MATYEIWADWFQYHEEGKGLVNISVTKALAAAGNYDIGDVLSENATTGTSWTFSNVVKQNGCSGEITKAQVICETTNLTPRLTLFLFTATPTSQLNDNLANTALLHADLANYVGEIDFVAMEDIGTGDSETLSTPSTYGNLPLAFNCASGANDLYGILVTRDAITGETATDDMTIKLTIEQTYLGEDLTGDVTSISFDRGKSGELGKAETGNLSLTLNNSSGNYSPTNSSGAYYGNLKPKRVIGVRAYDSDYNYQLFYGYVEEIASHPHLTEQDAIITAVDGLDYLSRHDMSTALYKDVKTGAIHDYILTDANWLRLAVLDAGQDTVPYWYGHDVKARFAQEEIDDSEQGFSYIDGFGYFNFEDRYHRSSAEHQTSQTTLTNTMAYINSPLNSKNIYNQIKVIVTPWELQAIAELWRLEETPSIPVGETLTWWGEASVSNDSVFVDAWTTPVATTDYTANSQAGGGGTDMTSDISIVTTKFAKTIKLAITNNGTVPAFITLLKARGTYYNPKTKVTRKAEDSTSQTDYQKRTLEIDGKYMTDAVLAQSLANYAIGKYKEPRAEISLTLQNQDSSTLAQILSREISDRINIENTKLGLTSIDIGQEAIDRPNWFGSPYTVIEPENPANADGTITTVDIWANTDMTGVKVGTFYLVSGTTYKCRDAETIGNVTSGSKQSFSVSLDAKAGDCLGIYWATGQLEETGTGITNVVMYKLATDACISGLETTFDIQQIAIISLYGYGTGGWNYFIDHMEHDITLGGKSHVAVYRLADCVNEDFWNIGFSKLGTQTKLGY